MAKAIMQAMARTGRRITASIIRQLHQPLSRRFASSTSGGSEGIDGKPNKKTDKQMPNPPGTRKKRRRPEFDGGPIKEELLASLPGGWEDVREEIKKRAESIGFSRARFTTSARATRIEQYKEWIAEGKHGDMGYLAREDRVARREDLDLVLPGLRAVLCTMTLYWPGRRGFPASQKERNRGVISCYSWGKDYHDVIGPRLEELATWVHQTYGGVGRWYVDTGPLMERDLAERAGLGFVGKNTLMINEQIGSGAFLAELLTTLPIPPDPPRKKSGGCGSCKRCVVACPTKAIDENGYKLDGRRCISYLTIENKGSIPLEFRPLMGNLIYGCDICQQVCPWNRWSWPVANQPKTMFGLPSDNITSPQLTDLMKQLRTDEDFKQRFQGSPIKRIGRVRMVRNVAVAMGNSKDPEVLSTLKEVMNVETSELVLEHMKWAVDVLEKEWEVGVGGKDEEKGEDGEQVEEEEEEEEEDETLDMSRESLR